MRKEDFAEVFGDIDENYVKEAETFKKAKKPVWARWSAVAACLVLLVGVGIWNMDEEDSFDTGTGDIGTDSIMPGGAVVEEVVNSDRDNEKYEESYKEADMVQPDENSKPDTEFEDAPGCVVDADVPNGEEFDAIWGGSYLDENNGWVVWLTENTPERQAEVFQKNPNLLESNTTFRTADFSLAYLTELLEHISEGMRDGTLSFVTSAGVMEQINRVSVTMTTDDEDAVKTVSSFDTLGGAIEFHYATGGSEDSLPVLE